MSCRCTDFVGLCGLTLFYSSLIAFFNFTQYGVYVNPSRVSPSLLALNNRCVCVGADTAAFLMSGVVSECLLFDSAVQGNAYMSHLFACWDCLPSILVGGYQGATGVHGGKRICRIRVTPIRQFWRRDQTVWSMVLDLQYGESTCVSDSGVSFPTRVEDTSGKTNKNSKCASIQDACPYFAYQLSDPAASPSQSKRAGSSRPLRTTCTQAGAGYPTSMGFNDDSMCFWCMVSSFLLTSFQSQYTMVGIVQAFTSSSVLWISRC